MQNRSSDTRHALRVTDLRKSYEGEPVLQNLNLDVPAGTIFGLIGPNGAGKSTFIGLLTGLLERDSGDIFINDRELTLDNELEIKNEIASVLQPPLLFENFTSYEFTTYVCEMYGTSGPDLNDKIKSLFTYFEIEEYLYVKVRQLSSGSRKKLAFCTAILTEPKLLFLDEPFESVDVISIGRMKTVIRKLKDKGTTIFITSHILEVVENLCDDIAILHQGKILAYLDAKSRHELQKDSNLNEIFENYIDIHDKGDELLNWF
ncbi:ABC transporter ATP-binding protein [Rhodohalobacter sp. SW132]|uniref:ABC transporter ATP-binding protein n=1 Tax=Rhodohalobacter sp. SW132 TaxID=2293433 RepID=UPI000E280EF0|nr:ABC transporter ATP-binding protein [Rhodohalobacter sp. SW132]REL38836.1 ABC transporter ATP-binding protein [Rhodohalobacter sp. SW132]